MKKHVLLAITLLLTPLTTQPTGGQTSLLPSGKPRINFMAKVTMLDGKTVNAENLMIKSDYKKIPVYYKPDGMKAEQVTTNGRTEMQFMLDKTPQEHTVTIDLKEISRIMIKNSNTVWIYKTKITGSERRFIEIVIDQGGTRNSYLVEAEKTKVTFDVMTPTGPTEHKVNIEALREINITGHEMTEEVKPKSRERRDSV